MIAMSTLYEIINILPFSLLSLMLLGTYAGIPEKNLLAYSLCTGFTVWVIVLRNMKTKNRLRSIGIVAFFIVGLLLAAGEEHRELFVTKYLWVIWTLGYAAAVLAAGMLMNRVIWIRRAAAAALLAYCITWTILGREISKAAFALICFVLFVRTAEEIQLRWKKSGFPDLREHITRTAPFFMVLCLIVYMSPAPADPYGWHFAKQIYQSTVSCFNRIYGFFAHRSEDYGNIGFSDSGSFLSGLGETNEDVLIIRSENTRIKDLKLIGCVSGEFKDRRWVFDTESGLERVSRTMDTMETSTAVRKFSDSSRADYIQVMDMNCESFFYNTRYIFSPAKIRLGASKEKTPGISENNGSIVSEKKLTYKDRYYVSSYMLNQSNPRLPEMLDTAGAISREEWEQTAAAEGTIGKAGLSYDDYLGYRKDIYERFCHTYGLSEEVNAILDEIKNSSSGRYETVKKLEYYLGSMEYSADCGPLPDYVTDAESFLDYFLLTSQKGYCMHYATAFVLMANEMGIPCRYVQGYKAGREGSGDIIVRQDNAHAWPEVYFDNVGWVAFEPTPGYSDETGWAVTVNEPYSHETYKFTPHTPAVQPSANIPAPPVEEEPGFDPRIILIPVLAVTGFLLLFYFITRSVSGRRYKRMSGSEKYRFLAQQNIRFIGLLGFPMRKDETLSEYLGRINETDSKDIKEHSGFIPVYERVLYSDMELTDKDIRSAESIHHSLRELVKKHRLRLRLMLFIKNQ